MSQGRVEGSPLTLCREKRAKMFSKIGMAGEQLVAMNRNSQFNGLEARGNDFIKPPLDLGSEALVLSHGRRAVESGVSEESGAIRVC